MYFPSSFSLSKMTSYSPSTVVFDGPTSYFMPHFEMCYCFVYDTVNIFTIDRGDYLYGCCDLGHRITSQNKIPHQTGGGSCEPASLRRHYPDQVQRVEGFRPPLSPGIRSSPAGSIRFYHNRFAMYIHRVKVRADNSVVKATIPLATPDFSLNSAIPTELTGMVETIV